MPEENEDEEWAAFLDERSRCPGNMLLCMTACHNKVHAQRHVTFLVGGDIGTHF